MGPHTGDITKATDDERCDIHQLIKKVEFESVVKNERISTYATYDGEKKIFRLDNEMPVIKSKINFAKFRIQSVILLMVVFSFKLELHFDSTKLEMHLFKVFTKELSLH